MIIKNFKGLFIAFLISLTALVSIGCSGGETKEDSLTVLYGEWPPDLISYLAKDLGLFEKHDVNVNLVQISGFEELFELVDSGEADVWPALLFDTINAKAEGSDWQVLLIQDFSAGADAILAGPDKNINSISDLKGKVIGVEKGTVGEFFLAFLLDKEQLSLDDVTLVDLGFDGIPTALESGEIDAGVTYEPAITDSLAIGSTVVVDSEKERGVIVDVFNASKSSIDANPEEYKKFMLAILEAQQYYNNNKEAAAEIMKEPFGATKEEMIESFAKLRIPDLRDNKTAFDRTSGFLSLNSLAKQAEQYLQDQGIVSDSTVLDIDDLFSNLIDSIDTNSINQ